MRRKDHRGTRIDPTTGVRRPLTPEENDIRAKIKKGVLPKYHFTRTYGSDKMERKKMEPGYYRKKRMHKLTWSLLSTFYVLTAPILLPPSNTPEGAV